jgi:ATP-dependent Zn protease
MRDLFVATTQVQSIPYSEFVQHLKDGDVESVAVGAEFVEGRLKKPTPNGHTTTRRRDDLVRATEMARDIVARYGMSPEVGQVVYERPSSRFLELPPGVAASRAASRRTRSARSTAPCGRWSTRPSGVRCGY